ncbi:uncharacterized protein TNCV_558561 [Trichonephila clavipes]|nr:uncharacterized protein TNCV_558561 [Trichonephila clavipes]
MTVRSPGVEKLLCVKFVVARSSPPVGMFSADKRITVIQHPPFSQDLTPYGFYQFLQVKNTLKRTHFQSVDEVKEKTADLLKMVTPNEKQHCFERWKTRMQLWIDWKE